MILDNITVGMMVCNGYLEHVEVLEILDDGRVGCSDGFAWEAEDLDVAEHTYAHLWGAAV